MTAAPAAVQPCALCGGACAGVDLAPLLVPELSWLWAGIATAADRRGDEQMASGTLTVTAPEQAQCRAAAAGLLSGAPLSSGQRRRVDLAELATVLARRGEHLTPGAVAAHAAGRRLAARARTRAARDATVDSVRTLLRDGLASLPEHLAGRIDVQGTLGRLQRTGWLARVAGSEDPSALVEGAISVLTRLPADGERVDRRTLVPGDPHALDGGVLPALVLALVGAAGERPRAAWASVGVDIDDLVGGLVVTGVAPRGWVVPDGATFTLPPRELAEICWAPPTVPGEWVFVTENPSVLAAATAAFTTPADGAAPPRVVCTVGTPSALECTAIGALSAAGWRVAVRADFDAAGLAHVRAMMAASPSAAPWRMSTADYLAGDPRGSVDLRLGDEDAPWAPGLIEAMRSRRAPVYEEDLLQLLLADIGRGLPSATMAAR